MSLRVDQCEVASNRMDRMIKGVDADGVPRQALRCEALLDPRSESQVLLDLHLALLKLLVGEPEFFLRTNLFGNVREGHDSKATAEIFNCPGTDHDRQTAAALLRQHKRITVVPVS